MSRRVTAIRLPSMSIVTPSFNQAQFLGQALASVHSQEYPELEHVVVDGGSEDGSVEVIEGWADRLSWWVSEPDGGQYDAINRGFARTEGEVMAWLNSDDLYVPGALRIVGEVFAALPQVEWLTTQYQIVWDEEGAARSCQALPGMSSAAFLRGEYLTGGPWHATGVVQQESTFWRRSLWERVGGRTDSAMSYAADFDLWARFAQTAELYTLAAPIGGFRRHDAQKTAQGVSAYFQEAQRSLTAYGHPRTRRRDRFRRRLWNRVTGGIQPAPASPLSDLVLGRRARHRCLSVAWAGERGRWCQPISSEAATTGSPAFEGCLSVRDRTPDRLGRLLPREIVALVDSDDQRIEAREPRVVGDVAPTRVEQLDRMVGHPPVPVAFVVPACGHAGGGVLAHPAGEFRTHRQQGISLTRPHAAADVLAPPERRHVGLRAAPGLPGAARADLSWAVVPGVADGGKPAGPGLRCDERGEVASHPQVGIEVDEVLACDRGGRSRRRARSGTTRPRANAAPASVVAFTVTRWLPCRRCRLPGRHQ